MRATAYSYRDDPAIPDFDDTQPIVIFDGMCVLCSSGVQWMLERDPGGDTRFAVIQDPLAQAIYRHYGLDAEAFDTFMVLRSGLSYTRWAGVIAAARTLPQPWRALGIVGRIVPDVVGDRIYDWVQRNRLGWFGERASCHRPEDGETSRFLTGP
jgi:predicted DCC family thiol-disulfide oxidoreductase YuxK